MGTEGKLVIGRDCDCDLALDCPRISRHHVIVERVDEKTILVTDNKSTNGTFINGKKIEMSYYMIEGDVMKIGSQELSYKQLKELFTEKDLAFFTIDDAVEALKTLASKTVISEAQNKMTDLEIICSYITSYRKEIADFITLLTAVSLKTRETLSDVNNFKEGSGMAAVAAMMRSKVINDVKDAYKTFCDKYYTVFDKYYETAKSDCNIWQTISHTHSTPLPYYLIAESSMSLRFFDQDLRFEERIFETVTDRNHILLRYDAGTKGHSLSFANNIIARMYAGSSPSNMLVHMVDVEELDGTADSFKRFNPSVYSIRVNAQEVAKCLSEIERHIEIIVKNVLQPYKSIEEYNNSKDAKEAHTLVVIEGCPSGLNEESLFLLRKIMKNGIRAGVNVILMIDDDEVIGNDTFAKALDRISVKNLGKDMVEFDFRNANYPFKSCCKGTLMFECLDEEHLEKVVDYVNDGLEIKAETVFKLTDFIADKDDWWHKKSAARIDIPFGLSPTKEIKRICFTQESGQNSAIVIGVPGSGKSVFLHSLILNASVTYSPEELQLYLLDFSGVEFNTYAINKLPHARIIAPEAEREFGLSVLEELKTEGERRMNMCRDSDVSNIVELKQKFPEIVMPRLLVVIDEFQKLFETDDSVSKRANTCIHVIIQEFRKFGINLILATQKLPSSNILPRDLIANRVVFRSSVNDFSYLISTHKPPVLRTGECVYTSTNGDEYSSVQTFLVLKNDREELLKQLNDHAGKAGIASKLEVVFRSDQQPCFEEKRVAPLHKGRKCNPSEVGVYFGESISISQEDVHAILRKESNNNVLIIGGEQQVSEKICIFSTKSVMENHEDRSASFIVFNFKRKDDADYSVPKDFLNDSMFDVSFPETATEVHSFLEIVKAEIDHRKSEGDIKLNPIYLSFVSFQGGRVFDPDTSGTFPKTSKESQLLAYILQNGPMVGVFTIIQVDNIANLSRLGTGILHSFNHRIALQMTEKESGDILGDGRLASRLFVYGKPYSIYRAYYKNMINNYLVKFKPYM